MTRPCDACVRLFDGLRTGSAAEEANAEALRWARERRLTGRPAELCALHRQAVLALEGRPRRDTL